MPLGLCIQCENKQGMLCANMVAAAKGSLRDFRAALIAVRQANETGAEPPPPAAAYQAALVTAASHDRPDTVEFVLQEALVSVQNTAALHKAVEAAAKHGHAAVVTVLLTQATGCTQSLWEAAVAAAARHNHPAVIAACQALPNSSVRDVDTRMTCIWTCLQIATKFGNAAALQVLLTKFGHLFSDGHMLELLRSSVVNGHYKAAAELLQVRPELAARARELYPIFIATVDKCFSGPN
jgi:ankyrin repeat protein